MGVVGYPKDSRRIGTDDTGMDPLLWEIPYIRVAMGVQVTKHPTCQMGEEALQTQDVCEILWLAETDDKMVS